MIPTAAFLLFIAYLFWNDVQKRGERTISWVPLAWMFLAGSRWVSSWMSLSGPLESVDAYAEGSPVDRAVFFALILAGIVVLSRRKIEWGRLLGQNKWLVLYFLYCLSSIAWSDDPFILVKRWIKDLGNPVMALVILTEQRPYEALGITLRRLAFLLIPLSVLFVKYYPDLGRSYHVDGSPMFTGVGHQKNDLGLMSLISGMYFAWKLLQPRGGAEETEKSDILDVILIAMLAWLLRMSDSQTSFACLMTTVAILFVAKIKFISTKPARLVTVLTLGALSYYVLESTLEIKEVILTSLGRDPTLTGRDVLWEVVLSKAVDPIIGAGFMSFWAGPRMKAIWDALGGGINQAHNGYLEQYLNLGYIGVAFIAGIMLSALLNVRKEINTKPAANAFRLCIIVVAALYNYTEASFYGINNMWVLLLLGSIDVAGISRVATQDNKNPGVAAPSVATARSGRQFVPIRAIAPGRQRAAVTTPSRELR